MKGGMSSAVETKLFTREEIISELPEEYRERDKLLKDPKVHEGIVYSILDDQRKYIESTDLNDKAVLQNIAKIELIPPKDLSMLLPHIKKEHLPKFKLIEELNQLLIAINNGTVHQFKNIENYKAFYNDSIFLTGNVAAEVGPFSLYLPEELTRHMRDNIIDAESTIRSGLSKVTKKINQFTYDWMTANKTKRNPAKSGNPSSCARDEMFVVLSLRLENNKQRDDIIQDLKDFEITGAIGIQHTKKHPLNTGSTVLLDTAENKGSTPLILDAKNNSISLDAIITRSSEDTLTTDRKIKSKAVKAKEEMRNLEEEKRILEKQRLGEKTENYSLLPEFEQSSQMKDENLLLKEQVVYLTQVVYETIKKKEEIISALSQRLIEYQNRDNDLIRKTIELQEKLIQKDKELEDLKTKPPILYDDSSITKRKIENDMAITRLELELKERKELQRLSQKYM